MLAPNTLLQNRYLVQKLVRQGGMGAVYQALDQRLGNTVALKETLFTDDTLRAAFEREAHLLARLRHSVLPVVSDHFVDGEGQFLVMQFISGDDLGGILKRQARPFAVDDVLRWADQLLDALDYLHTQHPPIVHRDIKPQNLKLTERRDIVLLDFGLAKSISSHDSRLTMGLSVAGYTLEYAPLEQILGEGTDQRSDLYALAATLYYILTGAVPPDARTRAAALLDERPDPLHPASETGHGVPVGVAEILHETMAVRPDRRPASAAAMRNLLRAAREQAVVPAALKEPASSPETPPIAADNPEPVSRVLATVLFTDIVKSTKLAVDLNDRVWRYLLEAHDALVRELLLQHRGREVKTTGDGFLAIFDRPAQAIRCACAIRDAVRQLGIEARAGVHTGEFEVRHDDVAGVAIHFAARVLSKAKDGEVLVSRATKDAVAGAGLHFEERGSHTLNGLPGLHELFAVQNTAHEARASTLQRQPDTAPLPTTPSLAIAPAARSPHTFTSDRLDYWRPRALGAAAVLTAVALISLLVLRNLPRWGGGPVLPPTAGPSAGDAAIAVPGTVLYQADWSSGLNGWVGGADWKVADGMLISDAPRDRSIIAAPYVPRTADYAVEADIQRTDDNTGFVSFSILARGDRLQGYWAGAHLGTGRSPGVGVEAELPSVPKLLMFKYFDPGKEWHRYRVDVRGDTIRMYVDGKLMIDVVDDTYRSSTGTGLWSWGTRINVRDFHVLSL
jgi:serine/threonine protein kinase